MRQNCRELGRRAVKVKCSQGFVEAVLLLSTCASQTAAYPFLLGFTMKIILEIFPGGW